MVEHAPGRPTLQSSSGKKTVTLVLFNLATVIVFFAALEFVARAVQRARLGRRSYEPQALRDRFTAWRNNPQYGRIDIHHNAQGFRRSQDVPVEKPANTVRIFFMGGSAAYGCEGLYSEIESRYSRIYNNQLIDYYLERKLNAAFPKKHWEVINAATNEYRLHQHLLLLESVLFRYRPDYVILMDGHNDVSGFLGATASYDPYASTPHLEEFNALANPRSARSFLAFANAWLRGESALFRLLSDQLQERESRSRRLQGQRKPDFGNPVCLKDLTPEEQAQIATSMRQVGIYDHTARQIRRILDLDGAKAVFLLQPELVLSRKPLTDSEKRLLVYHRRASGPLFIYAYERLYPEISRRMAEAAKADGFLFLDLTDVFDRTREQTFSDYCHLTPEGNRLIGERVFDFLREMFAERARSTN